MPIEPQTKELRAGVEILVATPGRLLDHVGQRTVNLSQVEILVLDEADRMLDMGFMPDIRRIVDLIPGRNQTLLFSATFSAEIRSLARSLLKDPVSVDIEPQTTSADTVEQVVYLVDADRKRELLAQIVRRRNLRQVLVFTRTKLQAGRLASQLDRDGVEAISIHGDRSQPERERALTAFKSGEVRVLVATDVAARGLDIDALPIVVNFELPHTANDYVHRIGRTGRSGAAGKAISLVAPDEEDYLAAGQPAAEARPAGAHRAGLRTGAQRSSADAGDGSASDARRGGSAGAARVGPQDDGADGDYQASRPGEGRVTASHTLARTSGTPARGHWR